MNRSRYQRHRDAMHRLGAEKLTRKREAILNHGIDLLIAEEVEEARRGAAVLELCHGTPTTLAQAIDLCQILASTPIRP